MWQYGFFNSINGDRLYNADQMSRIFEGLITDGVYESVGNKLAVQANNGMTIQIATGRGWFDKSWVNNDSEYTMTLTESDVILNRYVAVVIKVDEEASVPHTCTEDGVIVYHLHVAEGDMGRVIGKQGRIAKAIRTVMRAAAVRKDVKVQVDID